MKKYLDWLEFAETQRQVSLVPDPDMTKESFEVDKAFWKGYLYAARDASRYVEHEGKSHDKP